MFSTFISDAINHAGRQTVHTKDKKTRAPHRTESLSPNRDVNAITALNLKNTHSRAPNADRHWLMLSRVCRCVCAFEINKLTLSRHQTQSSSTSSSAMCAADKIQQYVWNTFDRQTFKSFVHVLCSLQVHTHTHINTPNNCTMPRHPDATHKNYTTILKDTQQNNAIATVDVHCVPAANKKHLTLRVQGKLARARAFARVTASHLGINASGYSSLSSAIAVPCTLRTRLNASKH